ncbi:MAG TPA: sulfurtransferase [Thermodesulfobacteriota bacterium]|nr:sulfurtransferase [Thermodesulfobacteriota bacterium]
MGKRKSLLWILGPFFFFFIFLPALLNAKPIPFKDTVHPRLVETAELAGITDHPSVRIIDMRTSLLDYLKGHIPNAVYLSFEVLQVPRNGIPAQAPDRITIEKTLGEFLSISNDMWVCLYSEKSNPNATYLAWTLDYLGHKRVVLLDGGWEKWVSEKLPTPQEYPSLSPKKFFGKVLGETLAEKKWVRNRLNSQEVVIVDARLPKQYSGEEGEEIRRGHIPGARNIYWESTLEGEESRVWRRKEDLEKLLTESGVTKEKEVVVHCRTGREASHLYFTLKHVLGFPKVRLYRGSWVEWSADKSMPVKTGMEP